MLYPYLEKTEVLRTNAAKGNLLAQTKNHDIVELQIEEGGIVPAHSLPVDVTFYVISGTGSLTVGNKSFEATNGDVIEVEKDLQREWSNLSVEPLKLLAIKQK